MQFIKNLALASAAIAAGVSATEYRVLVNNTNIDINTLGTYSVSYANSSLYLGKIAYQIYSEPYLLTEADSTYFLSYHQVPTGGQSLYIYANETQPVEFSVPHSGYIPPSASYQTLTFNGPGGALAYNGENKFTACQVTAADEAADAYQVYWVGDGLPADWNCLGQVNLVQASTC